ncbi:MAG: cytochrome c [Candidatus Obscuribacterales bacterium]|nr:cytochrome c [Candidatus Obscuribacterales bacterium]
MKYRNFLASITTCILLSACTQTTTEYSSGNSFVSRSSPDSAGDQPPIVYPMSNPSITEGRKIWDAQQCASCHGQAGQGTESCKIKFSDEFYTYHQTPILTYKALEFELPKKKHPKFNLTSNQLWDLVFFVRSLGIPPMTEKQIADIDPFFSANCAQCHGPKGYGDGPLAHTLDPRPANFHQYIRLYDRQDFMLFNHIAEGLYPAAMPPWRNFEDTILKVKVDNAYIKKLVQYVRHYGVDAGDNPASWWNEEVNGKPPVLDAEDLKKCCEKPLSKDKTQSER